MQQTEILGFKVFSGTLDDISWDHAPKVVNTINAYSYVVTKKDPLFRKALMNSDVLVPDGFPVVIAARIKGDRKMRKIAGADILLYLLKLLEKQNGKCFFLGSQEKTLRLIEERIHKEYPSVQVFSYSPPFRENFSDSENREMMERINSCKPDVLFVGMTAPKQEKWVLTNSKAMEPCIICSIGAAFDYFAGTLPRPSPFWIKIGMEWFIRLLKEPGRLWRRYLVHSPVFFFDLFKCMVLRKKQCNHPEKNDYL